MAKNILIPRRKRCFEVGGELAGRQEMLTKTSQIPIQTAGIDPKGVPTGGTTGATTPQADVGGAITGGLQLVQASAEGAAIGANNLNEQKKAEGQASIDAANQNSKMAEDVSQSYSAGQKINYLTAKDIHAKTAKELKDHKGWKNVLGTTGKGAAAGAMIGSVVPGIGTAIGAAAGAVIGSAAAGIGELFGWRKRKKEAERQKREAEEARKRQAFAVDYYNQKQTEQLASANDNAAKVQANLNRRSVLNLVAYGGRTNRKNYLIDRRNKLC